MKFVFTNIDANNQDKEYFFTIRHENDVYTCKSGTVINYTSVKMVLYFNSYLAWIFSD